MTYVVSYDISDEKIRAKTAHLLEGFGERVQESVFECQLDAARLTELTERLRAVLESEDNGNVRLYRVCADCARAATGIGRLRPSALSSPCIVT